MQKCSIRVPACNKCLLAILQVTEQNRLRMQQREQEEAADSEPEEDAVPLEEGRVRLWPTRVSVEGLRCTGLVGCLR